MRLRTIDPELAEALRLYVRKPVGYGKTRTLALMEENAVSAVATAEIYSLPACRLCSQLIERGEAAIRFEIDFYKLSQGRPGHGTVCWLHLEPCPEGDDAA